MYNFMDDVVKYIEAYSHVNHSGMVFVSKEIVFGKKSYPPYGNAIIVAGGSGSGKSWQIGNLFGINAKTIDVDKLKEFAIKTERIREHIKKETGIDITNWSLKNQEQVEKLHEILKIIGLNERYIEYVNSIARSAESNRKPNLIFDKTLGSFADFADLSYSLEFAGYEKKNIHLVWVLNDYVVALAQNQTRDRKVPEEIALLTHSNTARNMRDIIDLGEKIKKYIDGDFWITFNQAGVDTEIAEGKYHKKFENLNYSKECKPFYVKDAFYVKIKESGKPMKSFESIDKKIKDKIKEYAPDNAKYLWS